MTNYGNNNLQKPANVSDGLPAFSAATWSLTQDKILAIIISILFSLNF